MGYEVHVMAMNKKGKSSSVTLQGYTVKNPEKQTGKERNNSNYDCGFAALSITSFKAILLIGIENKSCKKAHFEKLWKILELN